MRRIVFILFTMYIAVGNASAGPPFLTDDPVPIDYRHAEAYLFSTGTHDKEGTGNRNFGFIGILLQYAFSESFYLGGELFYQTPDTVDGEDSLGFNVGGSLPLAYDFQLLFSAGRGLKNASVNRASYYLALYRAF